MQRVRVKICGLREPEQALRIAQMGADAIGLVFAPSPRWVSPEQAQAVTDMLPPFVAAVGVFVDSDAAAINKVIARAGLQWVQLHGQEPPELVGDLALSCIKAFSVRDEVWIDRVRAWLDCVCDRRRVRGILLDTGSDQARGGTGQRFNWDWVAQARLDGKLKDLPPLILSGGLDSGVVTDAIDLVQPWAVDVSSGVEASPGLKDLRKVEDFLRAVREGGALRSEFWM
jgi:phosphoribosylanthranilate isomerase